MPMLAFDLETTGVDVESDRVVTACAVRMRPDGTRDVKNWLADPGVEIPDEASAVHGVSTERARAEGRPAAEVVGEVVTELNIAAQRGIPVVGFNVCYDLTLLSAEAARHGVGPLNVGHVIDARVLDLHVDRYRKGRRTLSAVAEVWGVTLENAHDAAADAIAAAEVAAAIIAKNPDLQMSLPELHKNQVDWYRKHAEGLEQYFRRSNPDAVVEKNWPLYRKF